MSIQAEILKTATDLKHIITGNGNPEDGLVFRMKQLEIAVVNQTKKCVRHSIPVPAKKEDKKYLGFLTPKHMDMLWKWFIRVLNIGLYLFIIWAFSNLEEETKQMIIRALLK